MAARADIILYPVDYVVTRIAFVCDFYLGADCSVTGGGSTVTLFDDGGSLSIQATPHSGSFVTSNSGSVSFPFATFVSTVTEPFAMLPIPVGNHQGALFNFDVFFTLTTPDGTVAARFTGGFQRQPGNTTGLLGVGGVFYTPPSNSLPKGYGVLASVTSPPYIAFGAANTSGTIFGSASIAPEPSTIVLSVTGLGILGLFEMRRRRRST